MKQSTLKFFTNQVNFFMFSFKVRLKKSTFQKIPIYSQINFNLKFDKKKSIKLE